TCVDDTVCSTEGSHSDLLSLVRMVHSAPVVAALRAAVVQVTLVVLVVQPLKDRYASLAVKGDFRSAVAAAIVVVHKQRVLMRQPLLEEPTVVGEGPAILGRVVQRHNGFAVLI